MRKVTFLLGLLVLLLSFTPLHALNFWSEISGDAVWGDGGDTVNVNELLYIDVFFTTSGGDPIYFNMQTWFELRGTDSVTTVSYPPIVTIDPDFSSGSYTTYESWDGNLPDEFGITTVSMDGIYPGSENVHYVRLALEIVGDMFTEGMICLDSADADNDTYDWLFYPPATYDDICWPVKYKPVMLGEMNMWAEISGDGIWGQGGDTLDVMKPFKIDIYYNNNEYDRHYWSTPFLFTGTGDVTTLNFQDFWTTYQFYNMFDDPGPWGYSDNWDGILDDQMCIFGNGTFPGNGIDYYALEFDFIIDGDDYTEGDFCVEKGDFANDSYDWIFEPPVPDFAKTCWPVKSSPLICGDANDDVKVNVLDITYIITFLYLGGAEPYNMNMSDVDHSCVINILDVTYLINYLYNGGPPLNCPTEWPCKKGASEANEDNLKLRRVKFINE